jgi:lipoprotein signal peptidase
LSSTDPQQDAGSPNTHEPAQEALPKQPLSALFRQPKALFTLLWGTVVAVWLDQWSKQWALDTLYIKASGEGTIAPSEASQLFSKNIEVASWFNFHLVGNKGAAWGMFKNLPESWRVLFFAVLTIVALTFMFFMYLQSAQHKLTRLSLILIIGGAIGNFIDRLNIGYVIDFIDWHYKGQHWPTFNIADVWISVGVGLMLIDMVRQARAELRASAAQAAE